MGPVGVQELIIIFLVALVLFGPKKLPELGKTIAKGISEFRRAQSELKSTFEGHMRDLEKEHESIKQATSSYTNDIYNTYNEYDSAYHDSGAVTTEPSQSTEANPSTVGVTAPQVAESTGSHEAPAIGNVPRPATSVITEHAAVEPHTPESHSVNS